MFKRLESSGEAFLQTVERHVLRNYVYLHAIRNDLPLPVGPQDAQLLDTRFTDEDDPDAPDVDPGDEDEQDEGAAAPRERWDQRCGDRGTRRRRLQRVRGPLPESLRLAAARAVQASA